MKKVYGKLGRLRSIDETGRCRGLRIVRCRYQGTNRFISRIQTEAEPSAISALGASSFADRVQHRREPYTRCKPSPAARGVATAYGTQILDVPELRRLYIQTGGAHHYRTIFMDGRAHPQISPSYRGHSVGHWEGDTLVVDTVGFNEGAWIDNLGMPTTERSSTPSSDSLERISPQSNMKSRWTISALTRQPGKAVITCGGHQV